MPYKKKAQYYETDQMGVVHHSNYIRWFEEARVDFMERKGIPYDQMEKDGIISPVLKAECTYKKSVRFAQTVEIEVELVKYTGTRMGLSYRVVDEEGDLCAFGATEHCFLDKRNRPVTLRKAHPRFHEMFLQALSDPDTDGL